MAWLWGDVSVRGMVQRRSAVVAGTAGLAGVGAGFAGFTQGGWWPLLGGAVGGAAGLAASWWLSSDDRRRAASAAVNDLLEPLLVDWTPGPGIRPSVLLLAEHRVVDARGRRLELAAVADWLAEPAPTVLLVTGGVGVGKTRLSVEVAADPPPGWTVARLRAGREAGAIAALREIGDAVLVVVEAATASPALAEFLADVHRLPASVPVRVMLLARTSGWTAALRARLPETTVAVLDEATELPLQPTGSRDDLVRWYGEAVEAFDRARQAKAGAQPPVSVGPTRDLQAGLTMGDLHARALARVLAGQPGPEMVGAVLAAHERRQQTAPETVQVDSVVRARCVAVLTLVGVPAASSTAETGPTAEAAAAELLQAVGDVAGDESARRALARWVRSLYPGTADDWIGTLTPPLLAHHLTVEPFTDDPPLWRATLPKITPDRLPRVLNALAAAAAHGMRTADQAPLRLLTDLLRQLHTAGDDQRPLVWLDSLILAGDSTRVDRLLENLIRHRLVTDDAIDRLSSRFTRLAEFPAAQVELARWNVMRGRATRDRAILASAALHLGVALGQVGRYDEALAAEVEAIELWRELAAVDDIHQSELAGALGNRGVTLERVGRYDEALTAYKEAVELWRELAAANGMHRSNLSRVVHGLGIALGQVSRYDEGLTAVEEAVELWREVTAVDGMHRPDLARAVGTWAAMLERVGRYDEGLTAVEEAVELWRELAAANGMYRPELARAVHGLGVALGRVGRDDESLTAEEEAVELSRELAAVNGMYRPELARAVYGLGVALGQVGRDDGALAAVEEAVELWRELAPANGMYRPELARAVYGLGVALGQVGRDDGALAAVEEAVDLTLELSTANDMYRPELARAVHRLGGVLERVGRYNEALAAVEKAVELWRELSTANEVHRPELGSAVHNLGVALAQVGRYDEALVAAEEAVALWRQVVADRPLHRAALSDAERMYRDLLRRVGREDELVTDL